VKIALYISCFLLCLNSFGQQNDPLGAKSGGLGHASVALSDGWSIFNNQAGLAFLDQPFIGVSYENRFLLKELSRNFVGFAIPTESGTIGISALSFGYSLYNEGKYGLAYSRKLSDKTSLGIQLNYMTIRQRGTEYGNSNNLTAEIGFQSQITDDLRLGIHIFNLTQTELIESNRESIPTVFRIGGQYQVSDKVLILAESEKDVDRSAFFKAGVQYHIIENLFVRGGISTNPTYTSIGFGYVYKQFKIDFATNYQPILGYTPQFSISYQLQSQGE